MSYATIIVAGQSHIAALGVPLHSATGEHYLAPLDHPSGRLFGMVGSWPRDNAKYWTSVREHARGAVIPIFWGGNNHMMRYLVEPPERFDVVISQQPDLPIAEDATLLPETALRALLPVALDNLEYQVAELRRLGATPVIAGTPPPKEDLAFVREKLCAELHFQELAERLGVDFQTIPLSPPLLLYKLWAITQDIMREFAASHDLLFVPVPEQTQIGIGYLRPEYYADATHANLAYGRVMADSLWERCRDLLSPAA